MKPYCLLLSIVLAIMGSAGCCPSAVPSTRVKLANMVTWHIREAATPVPGLTEAKIWLLQSEPGNIKIYLWGDFATHSGSSEAGGNYQKENLTIKDRGSVNWKCTAMNDTMVVTINQQTFTVKESSMILFSSLCQGEACLLDAKLDGLVFTEAGLMQFKDNNVELMSFFLKARQRAKETQEKP
jgi:hypothetical protein